MTDNWMDPVYQQLNKTLDHLSHFTPKLLAALGIILVGYVAAKMLQVLIRSIAYQLDRLIQRFIKHRSTERTPPSAFGYIIGRILFWIVFVAFIIFALQLFTFKPLNEFLSQIVKFLPNIFAAVLIFWVGLTFSEPISHWLTSSIATLGVTSIDGIKKLIKIFIVTFAFLIGVNQLGIDISSLIYLVIVIITAILASFSLAMGIGMGDMVKQLIALYYIRQVYQAGQYVVCNGVSGTILRFTKASVLIDTNQGQVEIPAHQFHNTITLVKDNRPS